MWTVRLSAWLLLAAGCGGGAAAVPAPERTTQALIQAIRADAPDRAYALLAPELRANLTRARFRHQWRSNRGELLALADALTRAGPAHAVARVPLRGRDPAVLHLEEGRWRIPPELVEAAAMRTPLDTLLAFRQLLRSGRHGQLLGFFTRARREPLEASARRLLEQTSDPLELRVELRGDAATIHCRDGGRIEMRKEADRWRIHEVRWRKSAPEEDAENP